VTRCRRPGGFHTKRAEHDLQGTVTAAADRAQSACGPDTCGECLLQHLVERERALRRACRTTRRADLVESERGRSHQQHGIDHRDRPPSIARRLARPHQPERPTTAGSPSLTRMPRCVTGVARRHAARRAGGCKPERPDRIVRRGHHHKPEKVSGFSWSTSPEARLPAGRSCLLSRTCRRPAGIKSTPRAR